MMKKLITVENNQVIITDTATKEKVVAHYEPFVTSERVVGSYTSLHTGGIGYYGFKDKIKEIYKKAGDELGVSVAAFKKQLNGAMYRAYIQPNEDLHLRFSMMRNLRGKWHRDPQMGAIVNKNAAIIKGYIDDGIQHLAGVGLLALDSYHARRALGKGLWKRVSRTSKSKNDMVFKQIAAHACTANNTAPDPERLVFLIKFLNNAPTTVLKMRGLNVLDMGITAHRVGSDDMLHKILKHIGGPMCRMEAGQIHTQNHAISDTYHMIEQTGGTWNPKWSISRICKEHEKARIEQAKQGSSTEPFPYVGTLPDTITRDGFTAEL